LQFSTNFFYSNAFKLVVKTIVSCGQLYTNQDSCCFAKSGGR